MPYRAGCQNVPVFREIALAISKEDAEFPDCIWNGVEEDSHRATDFYLQVIVRNGNYSLEVHFEVCALLLIDIESFHSCGFE